MAFNQYLSKNELDFSNCEYYSLNGKIGKCYANDEKDCYCESNNINYTQCPLRNINLDVLRIIADIINKNN